MTREQKIGTIGLIVVAVLTSLTMWWLLATLSHVDWTPGDHTWVDTAVLVVLAIGVGAYTYDKINGRHRHHEVTIKSGFRNITVKGYKNAEVIASVLNDRTLDRSTQ